jgi:hypothetical protein
VNHKKNSAHGARERPEMNTYVFGFSGFLWNCDDFVFNYTFEHVQLKLVIAVNTGKKSIDGLNMSLFTFINTVCK